MKIDIANISSKLKPDKEGIWNSLQGSVISYPDDGNTNCFNIEDDSFWFQHRNECILSVFKQLPPKGTILDVGGGNGFVTKRLLAEGFHSILLEPGAAGAINAKIH